MIIVPGQSNVVRLPGSDQPRPIPDQTYLLMAAATMHEMGRLVEPSKESDGQTDK